MAETDERKFTPQWFDNLTPDNIELLDKELAKDPVDRDEKLKKIKLFLEKTRGKEEDEIFMTELLREFNYLSPRTQIVNVKINGQNLKMLFQNMSNI